MQNKILKNIPNVITVLRGVLGVTLLPALFFTGNILGALITFASLSATDLIDGTLARIFKLESNFGKQADPICDKALGIMSLILGTLINPLMLIPLALELSIATVGSLRYFKEKNNVYVIKIGKLKTVALFLTIFLSYLSALNPIFLPFQIGTLSITSLLQGITLHDNIKKLNEKENQNIINHPKEREKEPEQETQKSKQNKSLKEKYIDFRNEVDNLISSKEEAERSIGKKIPKKVLKK